MVAFKHGIVFRNNRSCETLATLFFFLFFFHIPNLYQKSFISWPVLVGSTRYNLKLASKKLANMVELKDNTLGREKNVWMELEQYVTKGLVSSNSRF
jgi:hypothetical protein